jgi:hypothetical protein
VTSARWLAYPASDQRLYHMLNKLEMYSYRGHTLVAFPNGVMIHVGSEDTPHVGTAPSLDAAMLAVDAILELHAIRTASRALLAALDAVEARKGQTKGQSATPQ